MVRYRTVVMSLVALALVSGCSNGDGGDDDPVVASPAASVVSNPPAVAGPRPKTAFDYIRELGIRPGSADDLLVRDLLVVADAAQAHIAVQGQMGTLDEVKATKAYRLRGGKVVLVSGAGSPVSFCLRAFLNDDDPRMWFYDTDRVLPRGETCGP